MKKNFIILALGTITTLAQSSGIEQTIPKSSSARVAVPYNFPPRNRRDLDRTPDRDLDRTPDMETSRKKLTKEELDEFIRLRQIAWTKAEEQGLPLFTYINQAYKAAGDRQNTKLVMEELENILANLDKAKKE